jgi:hypothetical protein
MLTQRRSSALAGVRGVQTRADTQYRLTRFVSIGALYTFTNYHFNKTADAQTFSHGMAGSFSYRINRTFEFTGFAGMQRTESDLISTTPVDPVIAAIIGSATTRQFVHLVQQTPYVNARFSQTFKRGVWYISGGREVSPGNGLFLASNTLRLLLGYTYTGLRRWSFTAQGEYNSSSSFQNAIGGYDSTSGNLHVARRVMAGVHFVASYAARNYTSGSFSGYNRLIHEGSIGIGFTPGDIPLRIW